jgi:hypothetical protein
MKPQKCFWYMLSYIWKGGKAQYKTLAQMPKTELTILQIDGSKVPIILKPVDDHEKKLGVLICPSGDFSAHLENIVNKELTHASRLQTRPLLPREARMSIDLALMAKLTYGGVVVTAAPAKLDKAFHRIFFDLLPLMGVNRHISKEMRMLPQRYQGLGLLNPNIEFLSAKIQLISAYWDNETIVGQLLAQAYGVFQIEVGLGGNIFGQNFKKHGGLSTHGWFKNLWELLHLYSITMRINADFDIPLLRGKDRMIMDAVIETDIFSTKEIDQIN